MIIKDPPNKFVDSDDNPIESITPAASQYEQIDIKRLDDGVEVKAKLDGTDEIEVFEVSLTDQMFRGVELDDGRSPRELNEDIRDVLQLVGYTPVDRDIKQY